MTRDEAKGIVEAELNREYQEPGDSLIIIDNLTQEKPYGWIFFFDSKKYLETGNFLFMLCGNGPVVFERESQRIVRLGTALKMEEEIARYEASRTSTS